MNQKQGNNVFNPLVLLFVENIFRRLHPTLKVFEMDTPLTIRCASIPTRRHFEFYAEPASLCVSLPNGLALLS